MKKDLGYDYLAKLLIIGDSGVGKTNILLRFCQNNFISSHLTTIGIDFKIKTIQIDNKKIRLQIWDTAGQQRFKTITQTYYRGSMGILLVYSIGDLSSFQALDNWMRQIKMHSNQNVVKVLIGNKCDLTERKVSYQQAKRLADQFGVQYYEVSARQNKNISQMFYELAVDIKNKILNNQIPIQQRSSMIAIKSRGESLEFKSKDKKKSCC